MKDHFAAFDDIVCFPGRGMGSSGNGNYLFLVIVMCTVTLGPSIPLLNIHIADSNNPVEVLACRADISDFISRSPQTLTTCPEKMNFLPSFSDRNLSD